MTTQPTRLEVRANIQLTDSQWLLDVMGRYDFTIPSVAFDEIINRIELLSASKPAAPEGWMRDALAYIEAGIESEGPLEAEHSIEARRLIATAPAAPAQSAEPIGWRMCWPNSHVDPNYWSAQFSNDPAYCRVMMQEYTAHGAVVELIYAAPQLSSTAVVLDERAATPIGKVLSDAEMFEAHTDGKSGNVIWFGAPQPGYIYASPQPAAQPVEQTRALIGKLLFALTERQKGNVIRSEDEYVDEARALLTAARPASGEKDG